MSLPAWAMAPDSGARKPILTGPCAAVFGRNVQVGTTGKFKRGQSKMRHILTSKATKTKRHLGGQVLVSDADHAKVARMLPYA